MYFIPYNIGIIPCLFLNVTRHESVEHKCGGTHYMYYYYHADSINKNITYYFPGISYFIEKHFTFSLVKHRRGTDILLHIVNHSNNYNNIVSCL